MNGIKLICFFFLLFPVRGYAFEYFTGKVYDDNKNPIENVEISVQGTNIRTMTDSQGIYFLNLPAGYHPGDPVNLRIFKAGYKIKTIKLPVSKLPNDFTLSQPVIPKVLIVSKTFVAKLNDHQDVPYSKTKPQFRKAKKRVLTPAKIVDYRYVEDTTTYTFSGLIKIGDEEYIRHDFRTALSDYTIATDSLDGFHQYRVAEMYATGMGTKINITLAAMHYRLASDLGYLEGSYKLAQLYEQGKGIGRDSIKAEELFKIAADGGLKQAQFKLGDFFEKSADYASAISWYEKAAENGDDDAQLRLGLIYQKGPKETRDNQKAYHWIQKAATQGKSEATKALAEFVVANKNKPTSKVTAVNDSVFTFCDTFDTNINSWELKDYFSYSTRLIKDGIFEINNNNDFGTPVLKDFDVNTKKDFTVSIAAQIEEKSDGGVGLLFLSMKSGMQKLRTFWFFYNGYCNVDENEQRSDYKEIPQFKMGKGVFNTLTVKKVGAYLLFYVNDHLIEKRTCAGPSGNSFGFVVCGKQKVNFDNFSLEGIKSN